MREVFSKYVSSKLVTKLKMLVAVSLVFLAISLWHLVEDPHEWRWAIVGTAIGIAVGLAMTMFDRYAWHENEEQVVDSSNIFATVMLVLYIGFSMTKDNILDDWITQPAALAMATSWLSLGVLLIRVQRLRNEILDVLKTQFRLT